MANQTFPLGKTITLTATVENAETVVIPDNVTWTADQGTISPDATNPEVATLVNAPIGTVNVTATTSNGIVATDALDIVDNVPASITIAAA
jgi:hypothetical protein